MNRYFGNKVAPSGGNNVVCKAMTRTPKVGIVLSALIGLAASGAAQGVDVAQQPLYVGSKVPGNLAIVPSVEFPTVISKANLSDSYSAATAYVGYFDSGKCYLYHYDALEVNRYFYPVSLTSDRTCSSEKQWSGNFLNWAATQTIDPFRSALTGGYRVRDTETETWLEKAIADRDSASNFPRRIINNQALIRNASAARWNSLRLRIDGLGNQMWFSSLAGTVDNNPALVDYNPEVHSLGDGLVGEVVGGRLTYRVSVRVKVCDPLVGLESNCVQYSRAHKPEGLIQQYSDRIRYSIFGYQNVNGEGLDGGVLRANQKFVGPQTFYPETGAATNAASEWDAVTGVQHLNPDSAAATATASLVTAGGGTCAVKGGCVVRNSGVINYLNKFGQMQTGKSIKSQDNVSELYYTAIRYFKNIGNVPEYSTLGGGDQTDRYRRADGFPIITAWNDPIRYRCQTNVVLGIGDTNTWQDKNLPSTFGQTDRTSEPAKPADVIADTTVDVVRMMQRIWQMEGRSESEALTLATRSYFNNSAHRNSAYIAALAYDSHTRDIRLEGAGNALLGKQTVSTHWVDVIEGGSAADYKTPSTNQYYLAGKYGGFAVPAGYDPDTNTSALPAALWTDGDTVPASTPYARPRNFYAAADATRMVESLRLAFKNIVDAVTGSSGGFASSSTLLETGTQTFQGLFRVADGSWSGDLQAYDVNAATGSLTATWNAASRLPAWSDRKIYTRGDGSALVLMNAWSTLPGAVQTSLGSEDVLKYLKGERRLEQPAGPLRTRSGILGDVVNSEPVFVGAPNRNLYLGATFQGAAAYPAFASANQTRTKMVYVGANDGMIHGFNAATGAEVFAYMPRQVISGGIAAYARPDYEHRYFVDGELTVADVYDSTASVWKTVLVGTMGRGGRGMFALDVTDPAAPKFLWEKSSADAGAFGNNLGKPIIAQVGNGDWRVLLGNGPNGAGGFAQLIVVDALAGSNLTAIQLGTDANNGLSGINVWASVRGGFSDRVYAGDMRGNLWRVSYTGGSVTAEVMFVADRSGVRQPITATPLVARRPNTNETWVFFGTGRYLNAADLANKDVQSWYGIKDPGTGTVARGSLREIPIAAQGAINGTVVRGFERYAGIDSQPGWYIDLISPGSTAEGERMVVPNRFRGFALVGTTRIPDSGDLCSPSGKGFVMAIDPFSGGRLSGGSFFDVDGDGRFTETVGDTGIPVSGIGTSSGPNNPIFIGDVMQLNLDDASTQSVGTNALGTQPRRVSWRELIRN